MGTQKILIAGVVGGLVAFVSGYLIWGLALAGFAEGQMANVTATNVARADADMDWLMLILGSIAGGLMISLIFGRWAGISTLKTGAIAGAMIGLLIGINHEFIIYATTNLSTMPMAIVDSLGYAVMFGIVGGVVGLMLGKGVPAMAEATA